MSVTGIVLAAGRSSRAACVKALAQHEGRTFVQNTIDALLEGGCSSVIVVVGPPHEDAIVRVVSGPNVSCVRNPNPQRGMLSSLQCALRCVRGTALVALVDHPRVSARTVSALIVATRHSDAEWLRPVYRGRGGHPFSIQQSAQSRIREADPEMRLCDVLRTCRSESVLVADPHVLEDFDTSDEIAALA